MCRRLRLRALSTVWCACPSSSRSSAPRGEASASRTGLIRSAVARLPHARSLLLATSKSSPGATLPASLGAAPRRSPPAPVPARHAPRRTAGGSRRKAGAAESARWRQAQGRPAWAQAPRTDDPAQVTAAGPRPVLAVARDWPRSITCGSVPVMPCRATIAASARHEERGSRGARLETAPTAAERRHAAAGGGEPRQYPWSGPSRSWCAVSAVSAMFGRPRRAPAGTGAARRPPPVLDP